MKLAGTQNIPGPPERAYSLLTDPAVLVHTMPGLKMLEPQDDTEDAYRAVMEIGIAAIRGQYQGQMQFTDRVPNQSYQLLLQGQGPGGFVTVQMQVTFEEQGPETRIGYLGEANVGGTIAAVGQRMLSGIANHIVHQFFAAINQAARTQDAR